MPFGMENKKGSGQDGIALPAMNRIILRSDRIKPFQQRHCWIFSGAVEQNTNPKSVGIAEVTDAAGQVIGYGFSDPDSQIVCRMFHFGKKPPEGFTFLYWQSRFEAAWHLRKALVLDAQTNTYRLIHAEGDQFPGLIVDVYGGHTAVVHTLIDATRQWADTWFRILTNLGFACIYHKHGQEKAGKWINGKSPGEIQVKEYGISFLVDVEKGQKTGFFIDQRENRQHIRSISQSKKVLNAFGFTGGFSVYALAGGAEQVVTVDISEAACQQASVHVALNQLDTGRHTAVAADCFDYLKTMPDDFDLIILDPPAFSKSKATVEKATKGYKEINLSALRKIKSGGMLATFSCSQHISTDLFQKIVFGAVADSGRMARIIRHFGQPADHPINICHPESEYLKGLLLYVE